VLIWDERHEALVVGAARGFGQAALARMRHGPGEGITWLVATGGKPIAVEDAANDPCVVHAVTDPEGICSLLHVPILRSGQVVGVFGVNYCQPHVFAGDEERVLLALAQRAALALDNAELFERERLSRERLEVALEAGRMGTWDWDARANSVTWSAQLEAIHGLSPGTFAGTFDAYLSDVHPDDLERVRTTIADSLWSGEHHLEYRIVWPDQSVHWVEARGRLLRDAGGEPVGLCGVCLDVTNRKLAEQERARLMQSERAALRAKTALEERQKLARELHDSVSQALYGIALGTQTALDALATDQDLTAADDAIRYVLELSEAGLAEMRSLIFELRPESLEAEGLIAAIERNVAAARSRHNLEVQVQLCPEPELTLAAKEAVYRIAQEALHNTVKHARAKMVSLRLDPDDGGVVLEVADDGVGFDPHIAYPGHLGLVSMRERAAELGGELSIRSGPGEGARLRVRIPTGTDAAP
jgi:PAS domain S-box-containing protein